MKKTITIILLSILIPNLALAQLTVPQGGTGSTTIPAGKILFGNTSLRLGSSDSFFWDNTNRRLGIGTKTPTAALNISQVGNAALAIDGSGALSLLFNSSASYMTYNTDERSLTISSDGSIVAQSVDQMQFTSQSGIDFIANNAAGNINFGAGSPAATRLYIRGSTGNVGIGTTTPGMRLAIDGTGGLYNGGDFFNAGTITSTTTASSTIPRLNVTDVCVTSTTKCLSSIGTSSAFPFDPTNNFSANVNSTSTALLLSGGLQASSTVVFGNLGISGFLFDSTTGRLGLGSSTPWAQLSVNPNQIGTGPAFAIGSSTVTNFVVDNVGKVGIGTSTPGSFVTIAPNLIGNRPEFAIATSGANHFVINTAGYTGIGTGAPGSPLHVRQFATLANTGDGNAYVQQTHATNDGPYLAGFYNDTYSTTIPELQYFGRSSSGGGFVSGDFLMGTPAAKSFALFTNGFTNPRIVMDGTGLVGIASSTPWGTFSINPNAIGTAPELTVGSSSKTDFVINNAGNIGVGTAAPTSKFHVILGSTDTNGYAFKMTGRSYDSSTDNANGVALQLSHNGSGNRQFAFGDTESGDGIRILGNALDGYNLIGAARQELTLGTDTTGAHVYTAISNTQFSVLDGSASKIAVAIQGAASQTADLLRIMSSGASTGDLLTVTSGGNVGIGSSTPFSLLSVQSNSSTATLYAFATTTTKTLSWLDSKGNQYQGGDTVTVSGSSCGTSPTISSGSNNNVGRIKIGSGISQTTCTINFADGGWTQTANLPSCVATEEGGGTIGISANPTATTLLFTGTGNILGQTIAWQCVGF